MFITTRIIGALRATRVKHRTLPYSNLRISCKKTPIILFGPAQEPNPRTRVWMGTRIRSPLDQQGSASVTFIKYLLFPYTIIIKSHFLVLLVLWDPPIYKKNDLRLMHWVAYLLKKYVCNVN